MQIKVKNLEREENGFLAGLIFLVMVACYSCFLPPGWQELCYRPALIVAMVATLAVSVSTITYLIGRTEP